MNFDKYIFKFHADGAEGGGGGSAAAGVSAATQAGASGGAAAAAASGGGADAGAAGAAAAAQAAPFFKGLYADDGKIDKTAWDRIPKEHPLHAHKDWLSKYDTIEAALTGGANANSMAVRKALAPLKGDEPPEILAERKGQIDTMLNVPKDPKGYGIKRPDTIPEQFWSEDFAGKLAQWGVENSVSPGAMKKALGMLSERTASELAQGQKMETEFFAQQQNEYEQGSHKMGLSLDKANELLSRGAQTLGIPEDSPILKNAAVRMACIRMTQLVAEDRLVTGNEGGAARTGDLIDQARDIARNPENPMYKAYHDPMHPDHETARSKWNDLYRRAKPRVQASRSSEE